MIRLACLAFAVAAGPALAQQAVPAPEYFVTTVMETSTAQILAVNCSTLSVNPAEMAKRTDSVLQRLTEDGFEQETLVDQMQDPTEAIAALQDAFVARHGLRDGADQATVCAAGKVEIAEGTGIGALLLEVDG
ncbi:MAG: DUF5333 family protein [Jannaschia sp.]